MCTYTHFHMCPKQQQQQQHDEAADFGRRRVGPLVIDARRNLSGVCGHWYPVVLDLHRFFIAIARAVVNHDGWGGVAPDPLVWSAGARPKRRRPLCAVRDRAFWPGPPGIWDSEWVTFPASGICADDIAHWPYTPGILEKWETFLGTLHWPDGGADPGVSGVSYVELLILYELWAGERLSLEKAHPRYLRPARPISVSAVPFGPGIDIWRSCRFMGALMRSLCLLPGGLARFVPCFIGANHCRLRHIGWEKCCHGLTSRPRERASEPFLDELLYLFRYPVGSGRPLLAGTLPLRYCFDRFACRTPTWRLPASGGVEDLVAAYLADVHEVVPAVGRREVFRVRNSGLRRKRIRLNRKPQQTLQGLGFNLGHVCGKDCILLIFLVILFLVTRGGDVARLVRGSFLLRQGQGWVNSLGCACPRLRLARSEIGCLLRCMREVM